MGYAKRPASIRAAAGFGVIAALMSATYGQAANLRATPSIALEETWDSNIFNTHINVESDFISRVTPGLVLDLESPRGTTTLSGFVEANWFAEHSELNTWTATKLVELAAPMLRLTSATTLAVAARYIEAKDLSRRNEIGLAPIPGLPPAETFVAGRTAVRDIGGSLQVTHMLTPYIELGLGGGGMKTEYLTPLPGLIDSQTVTGNGTVSYHFSPRTTAGIFGLTSYTKYDDGSSSRSYTPGLSGSYQASERTAVDAQAGMTFLTNSSPSGAQSDEQSPYGRLSIVYTGRDFRANAIGSYELTSGGSFGRATNRGNVSFMITDQVTPTWSWDLAGSYQKERSTGTSPTQEVETADGTAGVQYAAAEWATIRLAGYTFKQWIRGDAGTDITRSHVLLRCTLSNPYTLF